MFHVKRTGWEHNENRLNGNKKYLTGNKKYLTGNKKYLTGNKKLEIQLFVFIKYQLKLELNRMFTQKMWTFTFSKLTKNYINIIYHHYLYENLELSFIRNSFVLNIIKSRLVRLL